jgi:predicted nucleic acid-binding protein
VILVDTSVWIEHFRTGVAQLQLLLQRGVVATHPFVIGELACGHLRNRQRIIADLTLLPRMHPAAHSEVLHLIEKRRLGGTDIGWIDAHLLASAIAAKGRLWTHDRKLAEVAQSLGLHSS